MEVSKAIEVLKQDLESQETGEQSDYQDAVKLGIEALKRELIHRKYPAFYGGLLLPGETEEEGKLSEKPG